MSAGAAPTVNAAPVPARLASPRTLPALLLAGAVLLLCGLYFETARSIVEIWNSSETFAHGYLIVPISLWLIWSRRAGFGAVPLAPYWPGLFLLAACGGAWLLAELADVQVVRHYAFVAMIPACALAVLGLRMAAALAFPLLYLLLAVPFGEIFVDPLIGYTADFTVWAVRASGIPVWRDGANFVLPTGNWSVVEACSGVRYLIASVTLGCLYAYLTYRSLRRRLLFVALSVLAPIVANWLRAYMIVMIGHTSGMALAVGVDHLIYGWLFFGLVMFLMYWIGGFWREDGKAAPHPARTRYAPVAPSGRFVLATCAVLVCAALWPLLAYADRSSRATARPDLSSFQPAWQAKAPFTAWRPAFNAPAARLDGAYGLGADLAGLSVLYYRNSERGRGLIASVNRLFDSEDQAWLAGAGRKQTVAAAGRAFTVRETPLRGAQGNLLVWQWYWIDGAYVENDYAGKLLQARGKIAHGSDDGAALFAYAPLGDSPDAARAALLRFVAANLPRLDATLARNATRGGRP